MDASEYCKTSPLHTVILRDFNARCKSWCVNDKTIIEGTRLEYLAAFHGFEQLIAVATHLLPNSSSYIDLIFTDQPTLVVDCGVHPTRHPNYPIPHHMRG